MRIYLPEKVIFTEATSLAAEVNITFKGRCILISTEIEVNNGFVIYMTFYFFWLGMIFVWKKGKQNKTRSDVTGRGVWSGSPLFAYRMLY